MTPTPSDVRALARHMTKKYGTGIINKSDAELMRVVGTFLDIIGAMDKKDFLRNYSTTIGDQIYLNFTPGSTTAKAPSLESQIATIVHEHQHVILMRRVGEATYNALYLINKSKRAVWEAECYRSNMEMYHWVSGRMLDPAEVADCLLAYGCDKVDVTVARKILEQSARVVSKGGYANEASKEAIRFLSSRRRRTTRQVLKTKAVKKLKVKR